MPEFRVIVEGEELVFKTMKEYAERTANIAPALSSIGMHMVRSVQRNFQAGGRPAKWPQSMRGAQEGGLPLSMTAGLRRSIAYLTRGNEVWIGTNKTYGRIQQMGGTVLPKRAKALAIPLNREARRAAVGVQSIREIEGLFFVPSKSPGSIGVLARAKGVRKMRGKEASVWRPGQKPEIQPMFELRKRVKIPPRPYLVIQAEDRVYIDRIMKRYIESGSTDVR